MFEEYYKRDLMFEEIRQKDQELNMGGIYAAPTWTHNTTPILRHINFTKLGATTCFKKIFVVLLYAWNIQIYSTNCKYVTPCIPTITSFT